MSFLTAAWKNLILANYECDAGILKKYLPAKTELDLWQDTCYVSLVGFMFMDTRLMGIKIPFHVNFEEVNLRFYVRYQENNDWKRGVVFIKEIVPRRALSLVANTFYKEHYETMPMRHTWTENERERTVEYQWRTKGIWQRLKVSAEKKGTLIEAESEAGFITEHYWGYTKVNADTTFEYEVTHPTWNQFRVKDYEITADFGQLYGHEFAFLNQQQPRSVMLAEGSAITVESKRKI